MNKRNHVNKDIHTKKMYLRQGVEQDKESVNNMNLEGMVTVPPKVESDSPFSDFGDDDDDDFFDDDMDWD